MRYSASVLPAGKVASSIQGIHEYMPQMACRTSCACLSWPCSSRILLFTWCQTLIICTRLWALLHTAKALLLAIVIIHTQPPAVAQCARQCAGLHLCIAGLLNGPQPGLARRATIAARGNLDSRALRLIWTSWTAATSIQPTSTAAGSKCELQSVCK